MIIGVHMPKLSRQSAHVGPWHYTVLRTTNEAEIAYMLTTATAAQTPGHRLLCPGVFHSELTVLLLAIPVSVSWLLSGHEDTNTHVLLLGFS